MLNKRPKRERAIKMSRSSSDPFNSLEWNKRSAQIKLRVIKRVKREIIRRIEREIAKEKGKTVKYSIA